MEDANDNDAPLAIEAKPKFPFDYNGKFDAFKYSGIEPSKTRRRGPIRGLNPLYELVSSKQHQDIVRRNNFMPGQFEIWNSKPTGGNNKYWGGDEDLDNDGIAEYVVRRGGAEGPIVAVNGYTTKQSDWLARRKFYEKYPERENRKGKTVNSFMRDEYFNPSYDDAGNITKWEVDPNNNEDFIKYHKMYNFHAPGPLSPFRAIGQYIVYPAIKAAFIQIADNNANLAKYVRKVVVSHYNIKAYESNVLSGIYNYLVRDPVLNKIQGSLEQLKQDYLTIKRATRGSNFKPNFENPQSADYKEFERWLFAKKEIKELVKKYVNTMLSTQKEQLKNALTASLVQKINREISSIKNDATQLLQQDLQKLQAQYE